jgi:hypothetical protein
VSKLGPYDLDSIITGDCRELAAAIPDESVDLIFTDPPYPREFLPLYGWLAETAARVLKPNGFLLTYCGNMYKDQVVASLSAHMAYFWDYQTVDAPACIVWPRRTIAKCKSVLAYRKQGSNALPGTNIIGLWVGTGSDKRFHDWGQDESTARYFMDCFLPKGGGVVLEPFAGGGTTPAVCRAWGWHYLAFEIDAAQAAIARRRVANTQLPLFVPEATQASIFAEAVSA